MSGSSGAGRVKGNKWSLEFRFSKVSLIRTQAETEMLALLILLLSHLHLYCPGRLNSRYGKLRAKPGSRSFSALSNGSSVNLPKGQTSCSLPKHRLHQAVQLVSALTVLASSHWDGRPSVLINVPSVRTEQRGRGECLEKWYLSLNVGT